MFLHVKEYLLLVSVLIPLIDSISRAISPSVQITFCLSPPHSSQSGLMDQLYHVVTSLFTWASGRGALQSVNFTELHS